MESELSITDLGTIMMELFDIRMKVYDIGLLLEVSVYTLDSIVAQFDASKTGFGKH